MKFTLKLLYPYSFELTTRRLKSFAKSSYRERDGVFYRAIRGEKGPLLIGVSQHVSEHALHVEVHGDIGAHEQGEIKQKLARIFSTEVDLRGFYQQAQTDERMDRVIQERMGLHVVLEPTLYECLIRTIIGQQLNLSFAATLTNRLIQLAGDEFSFQGETYPVFPTPEQVARLDYEQLQELQFNRRKAEYVIDLSRQIAEGKLDLEALEDCSDQEVLERLLPIRGVGRWTVECFLFFGLARPDLLPAADIGLRNALRNVLQLADQPSEAEVQKIGAEWAPYRSYATFYLWDSLG